MSYEIVRSDGTVVTSIPDGTVDSTTTSINLIGKNFAGYGVLQNENFVALLENFANEIQPNAPMVGQLWYDKNTKIMKYRTAQNTWKNLTSTVTANLPPANPITGDQWWNDQRKQLSVYDGNNWILIGPSFSSTDGLTGSIPDVLTDTDGIDRMVLKFYISNSVVAIWSKETDQFTVDPSQKVVGFYVGSGPHIVRPGLSMADLGRISVGEYTNIDRNTIWGTAENALKIAGTNTANFLRKDSAGGPQEIEPLIQFDNFVRFDKDILVTDNFSSNIGTSAARFNTVYAKTIVGNVIGNVSIGNLSSDDLTEGNVNLYFSNIRARSAISTDYTLNYNEGVLSVNTSVIASRTALTLGLNTKANTASLANVAFTGNYESLNNRPIAFVPIGAIIMWFGALSTVPAGWYLCNGQFGTPDLRDRFVIGAGNNYVLAATGGTKDAVLVSHSHTASSAEAGSHAHSYNDTGGGNTWFDVFARTGSHFGEKDPNTGGVTGSAGVHSHTISIGTTGESGENKNLPPYMALYYIMYKGI